MEKHSLFSKNEEYLVYGLVYSIFFKFVLFLGLLMLISCLLVGIVTFVTQRAISECIY